METALYKNKFIIIIIIIIILGDQVSALANTLEGLSILISKQSIIIAIFFPKFFRNCIGIVFLNCSRSGQLTRDFILIYITSIVSERYLETE